MKRPASSKTPPPNSPSARLASDVPARVSSPHPAHYTIVFKVGTSSIVDEKTHRPRLATLSQLAETVVKLKDAGHRVVVVSSGAVGTGLRRLGLEKRPKGLSGKQAVAAVGQGRLMALYDDLFGHFDQPIGQILLTRMDLADRSQYLNATTTFRELLSMGVVPIVNENDTISTTELRFGDNDTLSAITAGMVSADFLFILTDVDALYTDNPRTNPNAKRVAVVENVGEVRRQVTVSAPGSALGTGGMVTKLIAAELATAAGCTTIVCSSERITEVPRIIDELAGTIKPRFGSTHHHHSTSPPTTGSLSGSATHLDGVPSAVNGRPAKPSSTPSPPSERAPLTSMGTVFLARSQPTADRKWWIQFGLATSGTIVVDAGAARAIVRHHSSLFAAGIVGVEGSFGSGQAVRVVGAVEGNHVELGKGIVNYTAAEIARVKGCKSSELVEILGFMDSEYIINRDNFVFTNPDAVSELGVRGSATSTAVALNAKDGE
ncbi:glutamate 5-kinase [Gonapodya prolifera JEL478]|uniref:Glutamate 5-kinase n=1 Tax=Gonapodya prolifera (strain JEL478) TaxID=1344416 RepID=A0A139A7H7_GONPJ|nr:glutamate 5-kinase [Gonapodya prolifera JEL478]|eukprot:KXS12323.1 glutamate 5-kinase [Gonapodya prolifera JEL478]